MRSHPKEFVKLIEDAVKTMHADLSAHLERIQGLKQRPSDEEKSWENYLQLMFAQDVRDGETSIHFSKHLLAVLEKAESLLRPIEDRAKQDGRKLASDVSLRLQHIREQINAMRKAGYEPEPFPVDMRPKCVMKGPEKPIAVGGWDDPDGMEEVEDEMPEKTAWIDGLSDEKLRDVVSRIWDEAEKAADSDLPLASTILRGAALEAAIITLLERDLTKNHKKREKLRNERLQDLIRLAVKENVLSPLGGNCAECCRTIRNLVHPHKLIEKAGDVEEIESLPELMKAWTNTVARKLEA